MRRFRNCVSLFLLLGFLSVMASPVHAGQRDFSGSSDYSYMLDHRAKKYSHMRVNVMQRYFCAKNPKLSSRNALRYAAVVERVSRSYKVDPFLVAAIIVKESTVRRSAKSSSSYGLMQVNWNANKTWIRKKFPAVKGPSSLLHSGNNIKVGAYILKSALERSKGNVDKALDVYRGKSLSGYRAKVFRYYGDQVELFRKYF